MRWGSGWGNGATTDGCRGPCDASGIWKGDEEGPKGGGGGSARSGRAYSLWGPYAPGMIPALGASRALQKAHR